MVMQLMYIEWIDSYGCSTDWREVSKMSDDQPMLCKSVGWVIENQDSITIIPHLSPSTHERAEEQGCGDMTIPTKAITKKVKMSVC